VVDVVPVVVKVASRGATVTVTTLAFETLARKLPSPEYAAVMVAAWPGAESIRAT
jgi:hypothetical protein